MTDILSKSPEQLKKETKKAKQSQKSIKNYQDKNKELLKKLKKSTGSSKKDIDLDNLVKESAANVKDLNDLANALSSKYSISSKEKSIATSSTGSIPEKNYYKDNLKLLEKIIDLQINDTQEIIKKNIVILDTIKYTINSKYEILKSILLETSDKISNQNDNKNFIVTKKRLAQFYDRSINKHNIINNVMNLLFIILCSSFILIFKDELMTMIKGSTEPVILPIYKKPAVPTILTGIVFLLYFSWFYINKEIKDISLYMVSTMLVYILFIQYLSTKQILNNNVLLGISILPFVMYYIIEQYQFKHHIIPMYKKDFDFRSDLDSNINDLIKNRFSYDFKKDFKISNEIDSISSVSSGSDSEDML